VVVYAAGGLRGGHRPAVDVDRGRLGLVADVLVDAR